MRSLKDTWFGNGWFIGFLVIALYWFLALVTAIYTWVAIPIKVSDAFIKPFLYAYIWLDPLLIGLTIFGIWLYFRLFNGLKRNKYNNRVINMPDPSIHQIIEGPSNGDWAKYIKI